MADLTKMQYSEKLVENLSLFLEKKIEAKACAVAQH